MPKRKVSAVLRAFVSETSSTLGLGERVVLPGLGVFFVSETKAGLLFGGTRKTIAGKKKVHFRASRRSSQ